MFGEDKETFLVNTDLDGSFVVAIYKSWLQIK